MNPVTPLTIKCKVEIQTNPDVLGCCIQIRDSATAAESRRVAHKIDKWPGTETLGNKIQKSFPKINKKQKTSIKTFAKIHKTELRVLHVSSKVRISDRAGHKI